MCRDAQVSQAQDGARATAHRQSVPEHFPERMIFINLYMKLNLVPMAGIEPALLTELPPQDSVSTNSTTSAMFD